MSEEVEATPITTELAELSGLDSLVAGIAEQAAKLAAQYQPHEIQSEQDFKDSKKARAEARKDIAALRADYGERMKVIRDAVSEADARVKAALAPLAGIDASYQREITAYDNAWTSNRLETLQAEYEAYAPALVPLVPLAALNERYGQEAGAKWLLRGTNVEVAKRLLRAACDEIAGWEQALEAYADPEDLEAAKAVLFSELDPAAAKADADRRAEKRRRVRELEEQRRAAELEARERAAQQAKIDTRPVMSQAEYAAELEQVSQQAPATSAPQPAPEPAPQPDVRRDVARAVAGRMRLKFTFDAPITTLLLDVSADELQVIQTVFRTNDVHGKMRRLK